MDAISRRSGGGTRREIGIRKSLGARRWDIMLQFLIESVMLSLAGGLVGMLSGALAAAALSVLFGATLKITVGYVLLAIVVSSAVGIVPAGIRHGGRRGSIRWRRCGIEPRRPLPRARNRAAG